MESNVSSRVRYLGLFCVIGLTVLVVMILLHVSQNSSQVVEENPLVTLDQVLCSELSHGWRVKNEPFVAGPYRRGGVSYISSRGGGGSASFKNAVNKVSWKLEPVPGVEQAIVPLELADGSLTVVVIERK